MKPGAFAPELLASSRAALTTPLQGVSLAQPAKKINGFGLCFGRRSIARLRFQRFRSQAALQTAPKLRSFDLRGTLGLPPYDPLEGHCPSNSLLRFAHPNAAKVHEGKKQPCLAAELLQFFFRERIT